MRLRGLVFFCLLLAFLSGIFYLLYIALKFVFSESLILGLLFLFFGLPVLGRMLFLLFFGFISSLLSLFMLGASGKKGGSNKAAEDEDDGVIDVKYKIIK